MALLWFLYLIGGEPIPMNVHPGDHILDLPLTEVANGSQTNLKNIIADDGFCFFLSPDCPHCQSAMANIRNLFGDDTIVFLLSVTWRMFVNSSRITAVKRAMPLLSNKQLWYLTVL